MSLPVNSGIESDLKNVTEKLDIPVYFLDEEIGYGNKDEKWIVWDGHSSAYANEQIALFLEKLIRQEFEGIENGR